MKVIHRPEIMQAYPAHYTFAIRIRDIVDLGAVAEYTANLGKQITAEHIESRIRPTIDAWQAIFAAMGASPRYESSLKALAGSFLEKGSLSRIHPLVDFYNTLSLYHGFPMAAYDINRLSGDVELCLLGKGRSFSPLGNPKNVEKTKANEVGYMDREKVICRYWNRQDCDQTKITAQTTHVLFLFDVIRSDERRVEQMYHEVYGEFSELFSGNDSRGGILGPGLASELEL